MTKLRLVPYRQLSKVAEATGFLRVRREGSHNTFRNAEGRIVVIPDHGSQVIVRPLLRKILLFNTLRHPLCIKCMRAIIRSVGELAQR